MSVSIILRLITADVIEPTVSSIPIVRGQAEVVETGETALFKDGDEMLAFVGKVTRDVAAEQGLRESGDSG